MTTSDNPMPDGQVDPAERARRERAIETARASLALEGLKWDEKAEGLFARYVDGELTRDQLNAEVLALAHKLDAK